MNFKEYVSTLVDLNFDKLQGRNNSEYYASVCVGLIEELLELSEAEGVDSNVKETGDVIAYATLICVSNQLNNGLHLYSNNIMDSLVTEVADSLSYAFIASMPSAVYPPHLALQVASTVKRHFREGEEVSDSLVTSVAASAFRYAQETLQHRYVPELMSVKNVLKVNIEKLRLRKNNGLLHKGRGDNR